LEAATGAKKWGILLKQTKMTRKKEKTGNKDKPTRGRWTASVQAGAQKTGAGVATRLPEAKWDKKVTSTGTRKVGVEKRGAFSTAKPGTERWVAGGTTHSQADREEGLYGRTGG